MILREQSRLRSISQSGIIAESTRVITAAGNKGAENDGRKCSKKKDGCAAEVSPVFFPMHHRSHYLSQTEKIEFWQAALKYCKFRAKVGFSSR
jgi:hypothetical protein